MFLFPLKKMFYSLILFSQAEHCQEVNRIYQIKNKQNQLRGEFFLSQAFDER